ncbi:hypothetical protein [Chryseobacterium sp.]|uniref:hypothetical protein n=1 Tax=Chryseobacterium sp. TaxID=1871047 RepID=UPI002FC73F4A
MNSRFNDENLRLTHFETEVHVSCPKCAKKAIATVDYEKKEARLYCLFCGYNKTTDTELSYFGLSGNFKVAASSYFDVGLWYAVPFKGDYFIAYNEKHLDYLEQYISAKLREHKDRSHFTLLEKLPKFYHEAKNRKALLEIIKKLRLKK